MNFKNTCTSDILLKNLINTKIDLTINVEQSEDCNSFSQNDTFRKQSNSCRKVSLHIVPKGSKCNILKLAPY